MKKILSKFEQPLRRFNMRLNAAAKLACELGALILGFAAILVAIKYGDVQISKYASALAGIVLVIIGLWPLVEARAKALWPKFDGDDVLIDDSLKKLAEKVSKK
jgi:hypothetical protein